MVPLLHLEEHELGAFCGLIVKLLVAAQSRRKIETLRPNPECHLESTEGSGDPTMSMIMKGLSRPSHDVADNNGTYSRDHAMGFFHKRGLLGWGAGGPKNQNVTNEPRILLKTKTRVLWNPACCLQCVT